jgi:hypothetical protein
MNDWLPTPPHGVGRNALDVHFAILDLIDTLIVQARPRYVVDHSVEHVISCVVLVFHTITV